MRSYKLRLFKLRLILRREENRRTRRKTLEARERPTTTTLLTWVPSIFENQHEAIPRWWPIQLRPRPTRLNLEFSGERHWPIFSFHIYPLNLYCHFKFKLTFPKECADTAFEAKAFWHFAWFPLFMKTCWYPARLDCY